MLSCNVVVSIIVTNNAEVEMMHYYKSAIPLDPVSS